MATNIADDYRLENVYRIDDINYFVENDDNRIGDDGCFPDGNDDNLLRMVGFYETSNIDHHRN